MYRCEVCNTCSNPREPRHTWWGRLGHYHELGICYACKAALTAGKSIAYLLVCSREPEDVQPAILVVPPPPPVKIVIPVRRKRRS